MYLTLENNVVVKTCDIVAIIDLDKTTVSKRTRDFLYKAQKNGIVINASSNLPKSFIVCESSDKKKSVYISQFSTSTLLKRTACGGASQASLAKGRGTA